MFSTCLKHQDHKSFGKRNPSAGLQLLSFLHCMVSLTFSCDPASFHTMSISSPSHHLLRAGNLDSQDGSVMIASSVAFDMILLAPVFEEAYFKSSHGTTQTVPIKWTQTVPIEWTCMASE